MTITRLPLAAALLAIFVAPAAPADAPTKLDNELTVLGATRAGNADGTIPAWTGGITTPPAQYKAGEHYVNPYADDKPILTIDHENVGKYKDHLSPGQVAVIKKYNDYKMLVYPTHRSASFPEYVYEAIKANMTTAHLQGDGAGVQGASISIPFPIPKDGREAIWNHLLRYRGVALRRFQNQATVTASGNYSIANIEENFLFVYARKGATPASIGNIAFYLKQHLLSPARLAGTYSLVHETLNQIAEPRHAWLYTPGLRRVRRAPNIAYDSPPPSADGLRTFDQFDMFNGAIDRYNWKLVGKEELYVPYNSYRLQNPDVKYKDLLKPKHINTDYARYELHRVWKVEATLKPGASHIYPRRTFYLDEDSWQALVIDQYDSAGQLWRVSEGHAINYYDVPTLFTSMETIYDLQSGRYIAMGLNSEGPAYDFSVQLTPSDFSPSSLRQEGVR